MLLSNLDLLASAPSGVAGLRDLILALAVQGRLLPRDASDEPAAEALKRIRLKKDALVAEGALKKAKPLSNVPPEEPAFELPSSWQWAPLSDLVRVLNGRAYAKQELLDSGPLPVLRVGNLFTSNHWYYSDLSLEADKLCLAGDLLYAWSASFGPFIWDGPKAIYHYHVWKLDPIAPDELDTRYLYTFLLEKTAEIKAAGHGVSMVHMTKEKMERILVPLPPKREQARIVARVEELMRLCDALEVKGRLEAEQHARLLSTLLGTLTESRSSEELAANWQRVATHFDLLLDRPETVDALEKTIISLAVCGRLVSQSPGDEPAAVLIERLRSRRSSSRDSPLAVDPPFALPPSWAWTRFDELVDPSKPISYGVLVPGPDVADGVPFVRIADLSVADPAVLPEKRISREVDDQYKRTRLEGGEILMGVVGSIGKLGIAPMSWAGANIARAVCRIVPTRMVDRDFVLLLLESDLMQTSFAGDTRTLAQPTLNVGLIRNSPTPLPPLAEQARIVARVTELRRLCADLRQRLIAQQSTQTQLAEALVATA